MKRCSGNAMQTLNNMEKSLEDLANRYIAERKEKDGLQQMQNNLRYQYKTYSPRDFEILEALCQELAVERGL